MNTQEIKQLMNLLYRLEDHEGYKHTPVTDCIKYLQKEY